jgi:hypothetical protein
MAGAEFARLKTGLAFYCAACEQPHLVERRHLWLEGLTEPRRKPAAVRVPAPRDDSSSAQP